MPGRRVHGLGAALPRLGAMVLAGGVLLAHAASGIPAAAQDVETLCTPTDPGLAELSGLASDGTRSYAIGDSGTDDKLAVLDAQCAVLQWLPVPVDPYDIEDLAISGGGDLWLSDTGDNAHRRPTVALIKMASDGTAAEGALHRLTYPDGAHDAEALLLSPQGRPLIVTKELLGSSGVYAPGGDKTVDQLDSPGPTPLEKVGEVRVGPTPGGPLPSGNSSVITGGAVSADGTVVALRTYTDVHLYAVRSGDIVAALRSIPVVVPLTGDPQGEAIAFTPDGDLLSGSESGGGAQLPPVRILRGALGMAGQQRQQPQPSPTTVSTAPAADTQSGGTDRLSLIVGVALGVAVVAVLVTGALLGRRRR